MTLLSKAEFVQEYMKLLESLEVIVVRFYYNNKSITDFDILSVYEALSKLIKAKLTNFPLPEHKLTGDFAQMYDALLSAIEKETYSLQEIQSSLKLLIKSVKKWSDLKGSQGYICFISRFL